MTLLQNSSAASAPPAPQAYQAPLERWHLNFIESLLARVELRDKTALEIGCGRGEVAREVLRRSRCARIHGIDSDLCGMAHTREEASGGLVIRTMDVTALDFPDGFFDAAYSLNVFEHIGDLPAAYRELRRVLKRGGLLFVTCSPIWSSCRGHHFNHWLADYADLIEPWGHLVSDKASVYEKVKAKKGEAVAADAVSYIFESNYLNRLSIREHKRILGQSGFEVLELSESPGDFPEPPPEYVEGIAQATGFTRAELLTEQMRVLLRRG